MNFYVRQQIIETMIIVKTTNNHQTRSHELEIIIMFDKYFENLQLDVLNIEIREKIISMKVIDTLSN